MNENDLIELQTQTQNITQIFTKNGPILKDGTFDSQKVKDTILEMAAALLPKEKTDCLTMQYQTFLK